MKHNVTRNRLARLVSERAKELLEKSGDTIAVVSRRAQTAHTNVHAIVNGRGNPNITTLYFVAKGLNTTVGYLLGEEAPEPMSPASDDQLAAWVDAFREVDKERIKDLELEIERWELSQSTKGESSEVTRLKVQLESLKAACKRIEHARDGDISLMRGMVDELKAAKKSLVDKLESAAFERRAAEQRYFVLAETVEKACESPTWDARLHGYVVSQDNMAAMRKALNKNPLAGYIRSAEAEKANGAAMRKALNKNPLAGYIRSAEAEKANGIKAELPDGTVLNPAPQVKPS